MIKTERKLLNQSGTNFPIFKCSTGDHLNSPSPHPQWDLQMGFSFFLHFSQLQPVGLLSVLWLCFILSALGLSLHFFCLDVLLNTPYQAGVWRLVLCHSIFTHNLIVRYFVFSSAQYEVFLTSLCWEPNGAWPIYYVSNLLIPVKTLSS